MFITKWMDIGEGQESNEHKLRSRLGLPLMRSWSNVKFRRGSICVAFDQEAPASFKFDSLLSDQSKKALFAKNPWPWPKDRGVSFEAVTQHYKVRHGKFLPNLNWFYPQESKIQWVGHEVLYTLTADISDMKASSQQQGELKKDRMLTKSLLKEERHDSFDNPNLNRLVPRRYHPNKYH